VSRVQINWQASYALAWRIQTSSTVNGPWTTIPQGEVAEPTGLGDHVKVVDFPEVSSRFWKIEMGNTNGTAAKATPSWGYSAYEIALLGASTSVQTVTASSVGLSAAGNTAVVPRVRIVSPVIAMTGTTNLVLGAAVKSVLAFPVHSSAWSNFAGSGIAKVSAGSTAFSAKADLKVFVPGTGGYVHYPVPLGGTLA
jgi:hypothetical protein